MSDKVKWSRPGTYWGIEMRSQLEISWACMLSDHDVPWRYEPFRILGDAYLPDFVIEDFGIIECKGVLTLEERHVLARVAHWLELEGGMLLVAKHRAREMRRDGTLARKAIFPWCSECRTVHDYGSVAVENYVTHNEMAMFIGYDYQWRWKCGRTFRGRGPQNEDSHVRR